MKVITNIEKRKKLSKWLVLSCFRNTSLETLHGGKFPSSKTGDFSDVKVITPYREIQWNELSRLSDAEMKPLIIEAVNNMFTGLTNLNNQSYATKLAKAFETHDFAPDWDEPQLNKATAI